MFKLKNNNFLIKILIVGSYLGISLPCMAFPIILRSNTGHYVVAEGGGGSAVHANRAKIGPWEVFQILRP